MAGKRGFAITVEPDFEGIGRETHRLLGQIVAKTVFDIEDHIKASMAEPKSGRVYVRGQRGTHQASAPGEAPAVDMGTLLGSVRVRISPSNPLQGQVLIGAAHAAPLEFGTSHMAPRPFIAPAADAHEADFYEAAGQAIAKGMD